MKNLRLILIAFFLIALTGCTFTFKGTDVEAKGEVVQNLQLESIGVFLANSELENDRSWQWSPGNN